MIDVKIKKFFFDRKVVIDAVDRATRKALSKAGAFIRTRSKSSIRSRKKVSAPGSPPSSHTGDLKKRIFFGYEPATKSVVVGPVRFRAGEAPRLLEFGGQARRRSHGKTRAVAYRPRPFMGPALQKEIAAGTIPKLWSNSVRSN